MANKDPMRGTLRNAPADAPEYLVTKTSIIDGRQADRGATVRYAGIPGRFLRPLDAKAKAIAKKVADITAGKDINDAVQGEDRTRLIAANLRAYGDELLNVVPKDEADEAELMRAAGLDAPDANRKELLKHAETTAKQTAEAAHEAGAVMIQLTGEQPSMAIPTTGPLAEATTQEKASTAEKISGKK